MPQNYGSNSSTTSDSHTEMKGEVSNFRRALPQFCVVGVKNLILLGWGLILGYPTILLPGLQNKWGDATGEPEFLLSGDEIGWIGSINLMCVPLGSLTSGLLMDTLGKRRMMQLLNLPMLAAWALFFFAKDITQIYIALGLSGMSGGLLEAPLLIYIADTVQPQYRGMLTASGTATVLGGVCLQFIIGTMLHWRTVAAISAIVPFIAFNAVFIVPESPFWLYQKNRVQDAQKSLQWLRGWVSFNAVETEFRGIIRSVEDIRADKKVPSNIKKWSKQMEPFMKRTFILPFGLIFISFIFQHFSGITPLQTFAIEILGNYHVPIGEYYATIFLGAAQVIGCIIGTIFVRSTGKRRLVFASFIGCSFCFFGLAMQSYLSQKPNTFAFKSNEFDLKLSIDNLEQDVFDTIVSLRDHNDESAANASNQIALQNKTFSKFDEEKAYVDPHLLTEISKLAVHEMSNQNTMEMNQNQKTNFFKQIGLLIDSGRNASQLIAMTDQNDTEKLIELLNITRLIILPSMVSDENKYATSRIVERIEQDLLSALALNNTIKKKSHLVNDLNELSTVLLKSMQIINGKQSNEYAETNESNFHRWLPLILLLCGTMFGHCGAKLFPWMLIGEVYPLDVRSLAAGASSAIGYLVGFASNKSFVSLEKSLTLDGTFWIYSGVSLLGCVVLFFILPETENKTLECIQDFFTRNKKKRPNQSDANGNEATNNQKEFSE